MPGHSRQNIYSEDVTHSDAIFFSDMSPCTNELISMVLVTFM